MQGFGSHPAGRAGRQGRAGGWPAAAGGLVASDSNDTAVDGHNGRWPPPIRGERYVMTRCPGGSGGVRSGPTGSDAGTRSAKTAWRSRAPGRTGQGSGGDAARHADGADPAPRPWWPRGTSAPGAWGWRTDGHAPRTRAWRGVGRDPAPLCDGPGVAGSDGGTQTVLTRRPGRGGRGYVSTRCPSWRHSGGHAAPRAMRRGVAHDPVPSAGWLCHRR